MSSLQESRLERLRSAKREASTNFPIQQPRGQTGLMLLLPPDTEEQGAGPKLLLRQKNTMRH